jgi:5-methylcytosine-specific restriction enzyme A
VKEYRTKEQKKKFYKSKEWASVRAEALARDNFECQSCKENGRVKTKNAQSNKHKQLDVDHVLEIEERPDLALDLDNLKTLCIKCHNDKHGRIFEYIRKPSKWDSDEKW